MRWRCFRFCLFVLMLALTLLPPLPARAQAPSAGAPAPIVPSKPIAVVPFELYHNRLYLPVRVNGIQTYTMILDTGAAETFVSERVANDLKLTRKGTVEVSGNGEGVARFPVSKNVNFVVGNTALTEKTVVIYDYADFEKHEGRAVDGTLGVNFFHRYVVEIDYERRKLLVYEPSTFEYTGHGTLVPLRITNGGTVAQFDVRITAATGEAGIDAHLAVDSGTYSAVRLFRPFVEKHALIREGRAQFASFGFGAGGEFRQVTGHVA